MTAVTLFDVLARERPGRGGADADSPQRLATLAHKLVASALTDYDRLREYEQLFLTGNLNDPALELELVRSLWHLYRGWADEAEQVLARARSLSPADRPRVDGIDRLEDAIGRIMARLSVTPESLIEGREQARQGQFIPAKELRDELHARLRT